MSIDPMSGIQNAPGSGPTILSMKFSQFVSTELAKQDLPLGVESVYRLAGYRPWDHDCTFELSFPKRTFNEISVDRHWVLPFEAGVDGRFESMSDGVRSSFDRAAIHASSLGEYGVFFFGVYFERKDKLQTAQCPSSLVLTHADGRSKLDFTYVGSQAERVADIALEAQSLIEESGIAVDGSIKVTWYSVRCELLSINLESVRLLFHLLERLGSGAIFSYFWNASIMGVDPENVNKHGFELYNRVVKSGLTADKVKVLFRLQFLDMRGLDVVRQLCEGQTHYTIPLGSFRHRKKRATVGVLTSAEGYRLALTFKEEPTEEEFQQIEATLDQTFDRKPFL